MLKTNLMFKDKDREAQKNENDLRKILKRIQQTVTQSVRQSKKKNSNVKKIQMARICM